VIHKIPEKKQLGLHPEMQGGVRHDRRGRKGKVAAESLSGEISTNTREGDEERRDKAIARRKNRPEGLKRGTNSGKGERVTGHSRGNKIRRNL